MKRQTLQIILSVLAVIVGLASIVASYHQTSLTRPRRELQVITHPPISLVNVRPEASPDIEVFYKGERVSNLSLLELQVRNSGNQHIERDDFSRPVSFVLPNHELVDAEVTETDPPHVGMTLQRTSAHRVELEPVLLNAGDAVSIRLVVIGASSAGLLDDLEVDGRIVGIDEIDVTSASENRVAGSRRLPEFLTGGAVALVVGLLLTWLVPSLARERENLQSLLQLLQTLSLELLTARKRSSTVFSDTFDDFSGWEQYRDGAVSQNTAFAHSGSYSLKKEQHDNPHGGYKEIGCTIQPGFVFSGWIMSPSDRTGGKADRLAVEDAQFNGYGFAVAHPPYNRIYIERREAGQNERISNIADCAPLPDDEWYQFKFYVLEQGILRLVLCDVAGNEIHHVSVQRTLEYEAFDRVAIHGGSEYYIDDLNIEVLSSD